MEDSPVCPHCGHVDKDCFTDMTHHLGDGDSWTAACDSCGVDYQVTMWVTHSFESSSLGELEKPATAAESETSLVLALAGSLVDQSIKAN